MRKFHVVLKQVLYYDVDVEADNPDDAVAMALEEVRKPNGKGDIDCEGWDEEDVVELCDAF